MELHNGNSVTGMALIVFLRGINVGGHKRFRPSIFAKGLSEYDVVNVGAAGTFVVRKPGSRAKFLAELRKKLPFDLQTVVCDSRDIIRLQKQNPFETKPPHPDIVRFMSILSVSGRPSVDIPFKLPPCGQWLVQVIASNKRFVYGVYRRHMKTIGYLGKIEKLFGVPATTRNWNTILAVVRILKVGRSNRPSLLPDQREHSCAGSSRERKLWRLK